MKFKKKLKGKKKKILMLKNKYIKNYNSYYSKL